MRFRQKKTTLFSWGFDEIDWLYVIDHIKSNLTNDHIKITNPIANDQILYNQILAARFS